MRIGLTGATGFIGRHVLKELMLNDVEVVALTRTPAKLSCLEGVQVIQADINSGVDFYPVSYTHLTLPTIYSV